MARSFTLTLAQVATADPAALRASILDEVGSEAGADSILRSIQRIGMDDMIEYFEMTEVPGNRRLGGSSPAAWRVRADRGRVEESGY
ncbi:MAG TPA: hypothetical protein VFZ24_12380 [Longimicrobiales bacterium]